MKKEYIRPRTTCVDICPCNTLLSGSLWDADSMSGLNEEPGGEEDFL